MNSWSALVTAAFLVRSPLTARARSSRSGSIDRFVAMCISLHMLLHIAGGAATSLLATSPVTARSGAMKQFRPLAGSRQADREFGKLVQTAVDLDSAAMLLHDDVISDRQAEPGAFPGGLGRHERLE